MKRCFAMLLCLIILLGVCGCDTIGTVAIHDTMEIPSDGWVDASVFKQIKQDNAIVTFTGETGGFLYEWTVFGEEIDTAQKLNFGIDIKESKNGDVLLTFKSQKEFGITPVLSIYLNTKWDALSATVYTEEGEAVSSASITGSERSVVNFTPANQVGSFRISADSGDVQMYVSETKSAESEETALEESVSSYLSMPEQQEDWAVSGRKPSSGGSSGSSSGGTGHQIISDGTATGQDQYLTDPVPEGKPMPVEPGDVNIGSNEYTCTFSIDCATILNNMGDLNPDKLGEVPSDGWILKETTVTFYENESVYNVLQRVCKENGIHMSARWTPMYNSAYVEGIHNLYEFDCGDLSGWMYRVNGWYPNYGSSRYVLQPGDVVEWRFTCKDLGADVGCNWMQSGG